MRQERRRVKDERGDERHTTKIRNREERKLAALKQKVLTVNTVKAFAARSIRRIRLRAVGKRKCGRKVK